MPKNLKTWSTCQPLSDKDRTFWQKVQHQLVWTPSNQAYGWILLTVLTGIGLGFGATSVLGLLEKIIRGVALDGCLFGTLFLVALLYFISALIQALDNLRTTCMDTAACAIGTVVHDPSANGNGDLTLDIAISPFSPAIQLAAISDEIVSSYKKQPLFPSLIYSFLAGLTPSDRLDFYKRVVESRFLKSPASMLFQDKYLRTTPALDQDYKIQLPIYRCPSDSEDPAEKLPVPTPITDAVIQNLFVYLPCVIEGHVVVEWLKNLRIGLVAFSIGFLAGCVVCMVYGGDDHTCAFVGVAVGSILGFLAWLLAHLFNNPDDSKANGESTVVGAPPLAQPGVTSPTVSVERGDIIVVHGSWVVYMLDNQYYEIHPVQAWYLLCRGQPPADNGLAPACTFTVGADEYSRICMMVDAAESAPPPAAMTTSFAAALTLSNGLR